MALTLTQVTSLGFKPSKRSSLYGRKYDTLVYAINDTDFLYVGYNEYSKDINNKIIWKSFKQKDTGERITYPVIHLGDTSFSELQKFIQRSKDSIINCAVPETAIEANAPMAVEEGSSAREIEQPTSITDILLVQDTADVDEVSIKVSSFNNENWETDFEFKKSDGQSN